LERRYPSSPQVRRRAKAEPPSSLGAGSRDLRPPPPSARRTSSSGAAPPSRAPCTCAKALGTPRFASRSKLRELEAAERTLSVTVRTGETQIRECRAAPGRR
jgi:hypothetical protein